MAAPLELTLTAPKPRLLAGEGLVLDLAVKCNAALQLEEVELNRSRTRIRISGEAGPDLVVTGQDHQRRFRLTPEQRIGTDVDAPAGSAWTTKVDLLNFRGPLAPGRYRISLDYTLGPGQVAEAAPVDVEVVPATTHAWTPRWYGGSEPRARLGALRVAAAEGAPPRLFYHLGPRFDPAVERVAVDLGEAPGPDVAPRLAHMNGIPDMRFERWAAWADEKAVSWVKLHERGASARGSVAHGLAATPPPALVDPPLHCADGRLIVAVLGVEGGKPALVLVEVEPKKAEGKARQVRLVGDPAERAVIVWTGESPAGGFLYRCVPADDGGARLVRDPFPEGRPIDHTELGFTLEPVLALEADQWRGEGGVTLVTAATGPEKERGLRVVAWDARKQDVAAERVRLVDGPFDLVEARPAPGGLDAALLGRVAEGWRVLTPQGSATVPLLPEGEPRPPRLVVGAVERGEPPPAWLVRWTRAGAVVTAVKVGP